jgi:2-keto-3-deoxy-L-rhamnonate aldolase RhmA/quercetin dioxygenase-like cupin family protein
MKTPAIERLREKLRSPEPAYGLWVTLESASITEMAVAMGLDWVVIDAEHGHLDWSDILNHIRATVRSDTVALVRIAELNVGLIKRVLDIGADGIVVPWMETVEQVQQAVAAAHYPPRGVRGIGGERATCWGSCLPQHVKEAASNMLVVPIIESVAGGRNIRNLVQVDGVEMFFIGPADYSSTAGFAGEWEGGDVGAQILAVKDAVRAAGKNVGLLVRNNEDLIQRREQGFKLLGLGLDGALMLRSLRDMMSGAGHARTVNPTFTRESDPAGLVAGPEALTKVPAQMQPDRPEVMCAVGQGVHVEIAHQVDFEVLVGAPNKARHLTTGIVTFGPDAVLPYHTHTFSESITLLSGRVLLEVEGRRYKLDHMDNAVIPRGLAHQAMNLSSSEPAVLHVVLASDAPDRQLTDRFFSKRAMPDSSGGVEGAERLNRFKTAPRFEAGPGATFIDYFNRDLIPGIEMSGGHGVFGPGGRLPCHIHDFDESICIIRGRATCMVEGRKYTLSDAATALQPRGRCHYFINDTNEPMEMLWVYAGPTPERIVMSDELCSVGMGQAAGQGRAKVLTS